MEQKFGIDISKWQGDFDLRRAVREDGVQFVIIKAGGGDKGLYRDKRFESNYQKAKELGIPCGCYWYSKATTIEDAEAEAAHFLSIIKDHQFELPVYMDVEEKCMFALPNDKLCDVVCAFCRMVEAHKYYTGIYSSTYYFAHKLNSPAINHFTKWIARWGTNKPDNASLWQFGGETNKIRSNKICGMTVDQDFLYTDFETAIKKNHLNNF